MNKSCIMKMPLVLGQLGDDYWQVRRSGLQWLCPDGHLCRPGDVIASCYVGLMRAPASLLGRCPLRTSTGI